MLNHLEAEEGEIRTCMSEDANIGELTNEHIDQSNTSSKKHQTLESQNRFTRTDLEPAPKDVFSYLCSYCKETLIGTDMFLAHQSQMHPDKVFTCTICKPHVVFYETKELFERHMLCHPQETIERDESLEESVITALDKPATEDYAETLPTGTTDESVSVSTPDDESVLITASNEVAGTSACPIDVSTLIKDDSENNFSFVDATIPYQENPVDTFTFSDAEIPAINSDVTDVTTSDPSHKQPDNLEITTIFNVQVETPNILPGISEHQINANLRMKLSKEFQGVSKSLQSRIIETIQKIASTKKSNQSRLSLKRPYNLKVKKTIMKRKRLRSKFGWYCRQCDLKFDSSEELEKHKSANTCSTHPCQYCGKLFHSKKILLEHERLHTNERPYMCEYCGKSFRTCTMLRTHHNSHSTNQTFVCPDCGKSYNNKASFHYHAATHNSQEFLCDICGKKLKHAGSLRIHKLKHSNPDAFKRVSCDVCGNLYESRYRMMEHRRLHTNERPYKCAEPDCFKMFRKLEQLRQHSTVHTNLRKFKCDVCDKSFKRRSNLKTHRKIHCQDYRYKCSVCLLPYNSLRELLSHRSLHTQEELKQANKEPFECPECKKILSTKVSLQQHLLTHTNLAPFMFVIGHFAGEMALKHTCVFILTSDRMLVNGVIVHSSKRVVKERSGQVIVTMDILNLKKVAMFTSPSAPFIPPGWKVREDSTPECPRKGERCARLVARPLGFELGGEG
uniref:C2H2-type domain-containing protein n=1 Tax=Timema poppense TaxID=170557 RepID=A0A7R9D5D6_TIMPO|nr:unnamed protein product [Timema poppensis]